ncbi:MAG: single-stranded DNA-binding protein [Microgenomates group bacterium]
MAKSLNKVQLIGNLTRDPELKYTPQGTAVCNFGIATNRQWTTDTGEKKDEADFHRLVAWNKLAEICAQLLKKGRKVYVEGRLSTRSWQAQDGTQRSVTEVVVSDMIILDRKTDDVNAMDVPAEPGMESQIGPSDESQDEAPKKKSTKKDEVVEVNEEDIPF